MVPSWHVENSTCTPPFSGVFLRNALCSVLVGLYPDFRNLRIRSVPFSPIRSRNAVGYSDSSVFEATRLISRMSAFSRLPVQYAVFCRTVRRSGQQSDLYIISCRVAHPRRMSRRPRQRAIARLRVRALFRPCQQDRISSTSRSEASLRSGPPRLSSRRGRGDYRVLVRGETDSRMEICFLHRAAGGLVPLIRICRARHGSNCTTET